MRRAARDTACSRNRAAPLKACLGLAALSWAATSFAQNAGTQGAVVAHHGPITTKSPAIVLLTQQTALASTCGGNAFDVNAFIDVDTAASADVKVTAPVVGLIEEFTDHTGANIGPYNANFPSFHILAFGGGLPPNTPITITITTYTGANLTGAVSSVSSLTFNCTNGVVVFAPIDPALAIPALSPLGVAAMAALVLALGALALQRRAGQHSR
jgi:hypothetical protein